MDTLQIEGIEYRAGIKFLIVYLSGGMEVHIIPQNDEFGGWFMAWYPGLLPSAKAGNLHDRSEFGVQRALERLMEGESPEWTS